MEDKTPTTGAIILLIVDITPENEAIVKALHRMADRAIYLSREKTQRFFEEVRSLVEPQGKEESDD